MTRPQCVLGRLIPTTPDVERIKREAWEDRLASRACR